MKVVEHLSRGVVALRVSEDAVFICWRLLVDDPDDVKFNVYRRMGKDIVKINTTPLVQTNVVDKVEDFSKGLEYIIVPVTNGRELWDKASSYPLGKLPPNPPIRNYISIPLRQDVFDLFGRVQGVQAAAIGDLDGDGEYEIVVKRGNQGLDPAFKVYPIHMPIETYKLEAYKLDGTFLWRIDLGPNIRPGIWYSPFIVFDLDSDGKAEVVVKIGEGAKFYTKEGEVIDLGDINGDGVVNYVDELGRQTYGPEYFAVVEGSTGKPLAIAMWIPMRNWLFWGDDYGNRASRHMMAVAYLDGEKPSLIIARGIYTHIFVEAWNWRNKRLDKVWSFYLPNPGVAKGGHNIRVADVDDDGKDEVIYGAIAIDHDGKLLWDSRLVHGDRFHVTDIDPSRPGLEIFYVQEFADIKEKKKPGIAMVDAKTGEIIWSISGPGVSDVDVDQAVCADIDPRYPGLECWASYGAPHGGKGAFIGLFNAKGEVIGPPPPLCNMAIWWDGDLLREHMDIAYGLVFINKWNYEKQKFEPLFIGDCMGYRTPAFYGDILGDWREEIICVSTDKKELRIYVSTIPTNHRFYTLVQDPQYRIDVAQESVGYMQTTYTSFYLASDMSLPQQKPNVKLCCK
ncbi:MAG: rhamnogalacturonan lyase [Ignisphaera sp.]